MASCDDVGSEEDAERAPGGNEVADPAHQGEDVEGYPCTRHSLVCAV